jgi:hypothetical protein
MECFLVTCCGAAAYLLTQTPVSGKRFLELAKGFEPMTL